MRCMVMLDTKGREWWAGERKDILLGLAIQYIWNDVHRQVPTLERENNDDTTINSLNKEMMQERTMRWHKNGTRS